MFIFYVTLIVGLYEHTIYMCALVRPAIPCRIHTYVYIISPPASLRMAIPIRPCLVLLASRRRHAPHAVVVLPHPMTRSTPAAAPRCVRVARMHARAHAPALWHIHGHDRRTPGSLGSSSPRRPAQTPTPTQTQLPSSSSSSLHPQARPPTHTCIPHPAARLGLGVRPTANQQQQRQASAAVAAQAAAGPLPMLAAAGSPSKPERPSPLAAGKRCRRMRRRRQMLALPHRLRHVRRPPLCR